ncbi:MAG TPA: hypothetical protein PLP27_07990 [Crocinitomicaceae bacterium]|nr:hypothetical protein [Crocinitomicaceae bacterium]
MKFLCYFILCSIALPSCSIFSSSSDTEIEFTVTNSIEKDLSPYNLPLKVRFPIEDSTLGNFKIQIASELDGFVWHLKKGENFQFTIEEIGDDSQIYDDKIKRLLLIDFFAKNLITHTDDMFITKLVDGKEPHYYISRKITVDEISFMITTLESGVKSSLYPKMLNTIKSVSGLKAGL